MEQNLKTESSLPGGTKQCPYCAELILSAAIKCKHCGEFLNKPLKNENKPADGDGEEENKSQFPLEVSPSFWLLMPSCLKMAIVLTISYFVALWPADSLFAKLKISAPMITSIEKYRMVVGISIAAAAVIIFLYKIIKLKSVRYKITQDRIEWSRGIMQRRVDNIDMFRIVDMKMERTLPDILVGIGSITLITSDKTDPNFKFEKLRSSKRIYDIIKKSSLDSDKKRNVVHLE
ncbi:MAG: PH domain-containing protein [Planctomycetaceae bacterium]|nr:PH domain-containing protein [Planctomycetaceae bacterium]